jgi:hypothetical protein
MRDQDEASGSEEENFQPRGKTKTPGRGANGKASKQNIEEEGPA